MQVHPPQQFRFQPVALGPKPRPTRPYHSGRRGILEGARRASPRDSLVPTLPGPPGAEGRGLGTGQVGRPRGPGRPLWALPPPPPPTLVRAVESTGQSWVRLRALRRPRSPWWRLFGARPADAALAGHGSRSPSRLLVRTTRTQPGSQRSWALGASEAGHMGTLPLNPDSCMRVCACVRVPGLPCVRARGGRSGGAEERAVTPPVWDLLDISGDQRET